MVYGFVIPWVVREAVDVWEGGVVRGAVQVVGGTVVVVLSRPGASVVGVGLWARAGRSAPVGCRRRGTGPGIGVCDGSTPEGTKITFRLCLSRCWGGSCRRPRSPRWNAFHPDDRAVPLSAVRGFGLDPFQDVAE